MIYRRQSGLVIKKAETHGKQYSCYYDGFNVLVEHRKTGKKYDENFFFTLNDIEAKQYGINLFLETWDFADRISRKHMDDYNKTKLNKFQKRLDMLSDCFFE